jgi:hypothetical protein
MMATRRPIAPPSVSTMARARAGEAGHDRQRPHLPAVIS